MRDRWFRVVMTIATSATIACGDEAVEQVTAPKPAATPVTPVANQWPYIWEFNATPTAVGIQISSNARFENDNRDFVASAFVSFYWANDVSAKLDAWLLNKAGQTINSGSAGMTFYRIALPVQRGDSTMTVRISTNNTTCGLVGKHSFEGRAAQIAIDAQIVQITLFSHTIGKTSGADVLQPVCPPEPCEAEPVSRVISGHTGVLASESTDCGVPIPPEGGGDEEFEVCFAVWRELWTWDYLTNTFQFITQWLLGVICFMTYMT
jgi:hypothetical protein